MSEGLRLAVFDTEYRTNNRYIVHAIRAALQRQVDVARASLIEFHTSHDALLSRDIDAVIFVGSAANVHWQLPRWSSVGITTVFWATEDPYELGNNLLYQDKFDIIFTNDLASLPAYSCHAEHLPLAGSIDHHLFPVREDADLDYDMLFVGTAWPNRVNDLNFILENTDPTVRLKIALSANPYIPKPQINDSRIIYDWRCTPQSFARLANRSKLTLTLGRAFSASGGAARGSTPPPRVFELALAGTAQIFITNSSELSRYFDTASDIITRPSIADAMSAIELLLRDREQRRAYALSSQERARKFHIYDKRIETILTRIDERRRAKLHVPEISSQNITPPTVVKKRNILLVSHNLEGKQPGGGVEVYLTAVTRELNKTYGVHLLCPERSGSRAIFDFVLPDGTSIHYETGSSYSNEHISNPEIEELLFNIVIRYDIELVHFHHLLGMPLSLPLVAKLGGARTAFTFHDYYLICDNFNLISYENKFCEFHQRSASFCDICLNRTKGFDYGAQAVRRNAISRVLSKIDRSIFSTEYSRDLVRELYAIPDHTSSIVEMLMPEEVFFHPDPNISRESTGQESGRNEKRPLCVKIPGNFTLQKGAKSLVDVMQMLRHEEIEFHILGREDPEVEELLNAIAHPQIRRQRGYQQRELAHLLADGDVSINFSIWPETYMISLSESWASGLVPIVSDLGAPAQRVRNGFDGFIVPSGDVGRISELLYLIAHDRIRLDEMKRCVREKHIVRTAEHSRSLVRLYEEMLDTLPQRTRSVRRGERIYFDRAMYAQRHANNKWTDTTTLWDNEYDFRHLGQGSDIARLPQYPIGDIPMMYRHLAKVDYDNQIVNKIDLLEDDNPMPYGFQERSVRFRIQPHTDKQLVEAYLRVAAGAGTFVLPLKLEERESSGAHIVAGRSPRGFDIKNANVICVHDGSIIEYSNLLGDGTASFVLRNEDLHQLSQHVEIVEGCDWIERVFVTEGTLNVNGWGFDPVSGSVPSECYLIVHNEKEQCFTSRVPRSIDPEIVDSEPIFSYSGFSWSCSLTELRRAFGPGFGRITLFTIQVIGDRKIASGLSLLANISVGPHGTNPKLDMHRLAAEPLTAGLATAIRGVNNGFSDADAKQGANTLINLFDARVYLASAEKAHRLEHAARKTLLTHYLNVGEDEGLLPCTFFEPQTYRIKNPEIVSEKPLLLHYWNLGRKEGRIASAGHPPELRVEVVTIQNHMDMLFYKQQAFGSIPFSGNLPQHYVMFGEKNNLRPTQYFDPDYYRKANADVDSENTSLFAHYLTYGKEEGRRASASTPIASRHLSERQAVEPAFDGEYYISQVPYLVGTDIDPICHFFEHGARNGINPHKRFAEEKSHLAGGSDAEKFIQWSKRYIAGLAPE